MSELQVSLMVYLCNLVIKYSQSEETFRVSTYLKMTELVMDGKFMASVSLARVIPLSNIEKIKYLRRISFGFGEQGCGLLLAKLSIVDFADKST